MSPVVEQSAAEKTRSNPVATAPARLVPAAVEAREKVKMDLRMGREHQQGRINWITLIAFGAFHALAVVALFFWSW